MPFDGHGFDHPTCENLEPRLLFIFEQLNSGELRFVGDSLCFKTDIADEDHLQAEIIAVRRLINTIYSSVLRDRKNISAFIKNPHLRKDLPTELSATNAIFCVNGEWYAAKPGPQGQWCATRKLDLEYYPSLTNEFLLSLVTCSTQRS